MPLKIEVSHRNREINPDSVTSVNGISVYTIDKLAALKRDAYLDRDKIRDLSDIVFICKNYKDKLSYDVKDSIADALERKGLDQYDYLAETQSDVLIDKEKLSDDFLDVWDSLGLISDESENIEDDYECDWDEPV